MIRGDMSVTEFLKVLWSNKIKVGIAIFVLIFGPDLYDDWQKKRANEQLAADRKAVDTRASIAGMMLRSAWESCSQIGIVNDMEGCANFQARLLQEQAAPLKAKMAIEQRDSYYRSCERFYAHDYCQQLLWRSFELSTAQNN